MSFKMQFVGVEKKQKWDDKLGRSRETRVATLKKDVDGEGWFKSQLKITSQEDGFDEMEDMLRGVQPGDNVMLSLTPTRRDIDLDGEAGGEEEGEDEDGDGSYRD